MTNPTDTSPLRGPAQVFLDHERITAAWGDRYEIAVSFSGDLWLFRVRGDPPGTWTEASSSAEAGAGTPGRSPSAGPSRRAKEKKKG